MSGTYYINESEVQSPNRNKQQMPLIRDPLFPIPPPLPLPPNVNLIFRRRFADCWGYMSLHHFQGDAIIDLANKHVDLLIIGKTGEGKSIFLPLTVASLCRSMVVSLVLFVCLGSAQVSKATNIRKMIHAYHLDKNKEKDFDFLVKQIQKMIDNHNPSHAKQYSGVLYASPSSMKYILQWNNLPKKGLSLNTLTLFIPDKKHIIITDGWYFKNEFQEGIKYFCQILFVPPRNIPILAMTATLHIDHKKTLCGILK